ncbi:MAG: hypothetical protein A2Y25_06745 [Candidatus Melainabacteria bacterium GWF2_37_15]|nr:MAG: hypothetical protein A2Y25_06745 [Candidatus Melainabacteria bacterium GWF2_37_15]
MRKLLIMMFVFLLPVCVFAATYQKTIANLHKAMQGEANASHRYQLYAQKAESEGYPQIAKLFKAISMSESIHLKNHTAALNALGGKPETIKYVEVQVGTTRENLSQPIKGEATEAEKMYPQYLEQAQWENAEPAVQSFTHALYAEMEHEQLLKDALANFGNNKEMDYCVSSISGDTKAILPNQQCPIESDKLERYARISK